MNRDVTVREVPNREFVGVSESDDLLETVELLAAEGSDTALVMQGAEPVGILTHHDILGLLADEGGVGGVAVGDTMQSTVPTIESQATAEEAADRMAAEGIRRLVVTDGGETLGTLTEHDLFATRPLASNGPETGQAHPAGEAETALAADAGTGVESETGDGFEEQSICEGCGTLTGDLVGFNGQLLCGDCRDI